MSYILDALRKADRERALGDVPDLEAAHWGVRRPDRRSWRWLWIVAVLLVFNAALLLYMTHRNRTQTPVATGTPPAPAVTRAPVPPPAVAHAPAAPPAVVRAPVAPPAQTVAALPPVNTVTETPNEPPAGQPEPTAIQPPRVLRPKVAVQPHYNEPQAQAVTGMPVAGATPRVLKATEPLTPSAEPAATGLPEWRDLPLELRSHFTMAHIDVYVYDDDPQRRFILVNLKKYREGDTLPDGPVLEKILPGYLVLNYQGTRFRYDR